MSGVGRAGVGFDVADSVVHVMLKAPTIAHVERLDAPLA